MIARPEDLNYDLAYRAHCGTSMTPDRRAKSAQQDYANDVNGLRDELATLCTNDEQREVLEAEMERYRVNYLKHYGAYLSSHSNVVSSFIAGPSNFPVARMEKRSRWAHNKLTAFLEWRKKASAAIRRKIMDARSREEKDTAAWHALRRDLLRSLEVISQIDAGASFYTRSAFVNSIAGKIERLANSGETALVGQAIELVEQYNATHDKPAISKRHKFWTFAALAQEHAGRLDAIADAPNSTIAETDGVSIVANQQEDRVQILFDAIPPAELRQQLKKAGWKWSPRNGAWQRKLTPAAIESAKSIVCVQLA